MGAALQVGRGGAGASLVLQPRLLLLLHHQSHVLAGVISECRVHLLHRLGVRLVVPPH